MHRRTAGIKMLRAGTVQFLLQVRSKFTIDGLIRPRRTGRRHGSGLDLDEDFLKVFGVFANLAEVLVSKNESSGLQFLVVAGNAVLAHKRVVGCPRSGGCGSLSVHRVRSEQYAQDKG